MVFQIPLLGTFLRAQTWKIPLADQTLGVIEKSRIKNALCLSRNSFDPSGATGLFQAAEGNHKDQKEASALKHVVLHECCYLSSLRKLHPPFQQEGGLAENSSGVIFQLQKL